MKLSPTPKRQMSRDSVRFEDVLTQLEAKRQALEKREQETDRLYRQREEDARKAREFREQMQRAKENARSRGEAEAKRILRDARSASDAGVCRTGTDAEGAGQGRPGHQRQ